MAVTMNTIAERVGVTRVAVSYALSGKPGVSDATRRKIQEVARQLCYMPNQSARSIATGRFGCAALVLSATSGDRSTIPQPLLRGLNHALAQRDMHLSIAQLSDEKLTSEGYVPKILREWMADGLLLNYNKQIPDEMVELMEKFHLPSIWLNVKDVADCVYPDDYEAAVTATRRLIEAGHRRITFVDFSGTPINRHYSEVDRRGGYEQAMRDAGLTVQSIYQREATANQWTTERRVAAVKPLLESDDRPTAFVTYSAANAATIMWVAAGLGLSVPGDVSLITFGDSEGRAGIMIDEMSLPHQQIADQAVAMLMRKIADPETPQPPEPVEFIYRRGETIAPPPELAVAD